MRRVNGIENTCKVSLWDQMDLRMEYQWYPPPTEKKEKKRMFNWFGIEFERKRGERYERSWYSVTKN